MREPIYQVEKINDLKDMLKKSGEKFGDRPAFIYKTKKVDKFKYITHKEFRDDIDALGTELISMGLKDKKIAVISENRYEWCMAYLAIVAGTGIVVPLDKSLPNNEIESLIKRADIEAIFYSEKYDAVMDNIKEKNETKIKYFISMDLKKEKKDIFSQEELVKQGKKRIKKGDTSFINAEIDNEKMGIMLFTSGTTAQSKAVMLSHKNICANLMDIASVIEITEEDRYLSFLPLHHTFECTVAFLHAIYKGSSTAFCAGIRHIAEDMKIYHTTAMISVPALYENMYKRVMRTIEKQGKLEKIKAGIKVSQLFLKMGVDIRKKLFKEIHDSLGGEVRILVSGGAALDPKIEKGFNELGFKMYQGYGLTETSPVIATEDDKFRKIGTIGKAFPSLEVRIDNPDEDGIGELVVKGPSVMLGYYNNEEETKKVLKDGWLYTGDLAKIDRDGYIQISGRKKYVIVLKNGKNIFPEEIEALIDKLEEVKESMVYGKPEIDGDYKICVKIVYDKEFINKKYGDLDDEAINKLMNDKIKKINHSMPTYKYVREILLTDNELEKTTTQKIKRNVEIAKIMK